MQRRLNSRLATGGGCIIGRFGLSIVVIGEDDAVAGIVREEQADEAGLRADIGDSVVKVSSESIFVAAGVFGNFAESKVVKIISREGGKVVRVEYAGKLVE